jgi:hypothetical protein
MVLLFFDVYLFAVFLSLTLSRSLALYSFETRLRNYVGCLRVYLYGEDDDIDGGDDDHLSDSKIRNDGNNDLWDAINNSE